MLNESSSFLRQDTAPSSSYPACSLEQAKSAMARALLNYRERLQGRKESRGTQKIARIEIPIAAVQPLDWLRHQTIRPKTYWSSREQDFEMAGVGKADILQAQEPVAFPSVFARLRAGLSSKYAHLRYYGAFRFYGRHSEKASWHRFGTHYFILPQWEICVAAGQSIFACNLPGRKAVDRDGEIDRLLAELQRLDFQPNGAHLHLPKRVERRDLPDELQWRAMVRRALARIEADAVRKVVLARKSTFIFNGAVDPVNVLQRLKRANPHLFHFCLQPAPEHAFIGGSPERLYRRDKQMIKSEAIAGTRPRGTTPRQDRALAQELLHCDKDIREHHFVLEHVRHSLAELCHTVDSDDELTILKLARVQHLRCRLQGVLAEEISDAQILQALHPTPAVGGSPTPAAIAELRALEPFDRGWYAAPVGWVSHDAAEFVVGIRSGMVRENALALFSGAGIVRGSTPEGEWAEIENKIANFMKAIAAP